MMERDRVLQGNSTSFFLAVGSFILVAFVVWLARFDYTWATGDQDEFVPYLLHLLDSDVLATDWYVQTQSRAVGVRTGFVWLLRLLCVAVTPRTAIGALFLVSWIGTGMALAYIVRELRETVTGAAVVIVVALCLTPKWTLGGNDVVYSMLVPEMAAWPIALFGVVAFLRQRFAIAGLLFGLSALLQLLVGIHLTLVLAVAYLLSSRSRNRVRNTLTLCGTAALAAAPIALPILYQQVTAEMPITPGGPDVVEILAHIRAPYHYLASTFSLGSYVKFGIVVVAGLTSMFVVRRLFAEDRRLRVLPTALAVIALLCLAAWFFSEVYPLSLIVKLQLFKSSVIAKVICLTLLGAAIPDPDFHRLSKFFQQPSVRAAAAALPLLLVIALFTDVVREEHIEPISAVESWARADVEPDALFAIPPSISSFRSRAQHAILVNYAAVPFRPEDMREWYARLRNLAPVAAPVRGIALKAQLDEAYHHRTLDDWMRLREQYGIDYFVYARTAEPAYPLPVVYKDSYWSVYRLTEERPPS